MRLRASQIRSHIRNCQDRVDNFYVLHHPFCPLSPLTPSRFPRTAYAARGRFRDALPPDQHGEGGDGNVFHPSVSFRSSSRSRGSALCITGFLTLGRNMLIYSFIYIYFQSVTLADTSLTPDTSGVPGCHWSVKHTDTSYLPSIQILTPEISPKCHHIPLTPPSPGLTSRRPRPHLAGHPATWCG